jgi:hypothetical protein
VVLDRRQLASGQAASFRVDEQSPDITRILNDLGWLFFVGVPSTLLVQIAVIGVAALIDNRDTPIFPRWYGYYSLWTALLLAPAGVVVLFKRGPFAWNGLFTFWLAVCAFCVRMVITFRLLTGAITAEESLAPAGVGTDVN